MLLKLITFDVTGTILLLKEPVGHQYAKVAKRHGIDVAPEILSNNFYNVFKRLLVENPNFGEKSGIGWNEWWRKLVLNVFQDALPGENLSQNYKIDKISSDVIELYKTKECWKLAEGAHNLLDKLKRMDMRLGVISNYDPRLKYILQDLNIDNHFSFILTSYEAKHEKPEAAIFKLVEDLNNDLRKNEILHVGDNPELDFIGAKNMGWNALLIADNFMKIANKFPNIEEEWVVKNITEIYPTLEKRKML